VLTPEVAREAQERLYRGDSRRQVAEQLGLKPDTLRKAIHQGRLSEPRRDSPAEPCRDSPAELRREAPAEPCRDSPAETASGLISRTAARRSDGTVC